jgi:hypothetical protein
MSFRGAKVQTRGRNNSGASVRGTSNGTMHPTIAQDRLRKVENPSQTGLLHFELRYPQIFEL